MGTRCSGAPCLAGTVRLLPAMRLFFVNEPSSSTSISSSTSSLRSRCTNGLQFSSFGSFSTMRRFERVPTDIVSCYGLVSHVRSWRVPAPSRLLRVLFPRVEALMAVADVHYELMSPHRSCDRRDEEVAQVLNVVAQTRCRGKSDARNTRFWWGNRTALKCNDASGIYNAASTTPPKHKHLTCTSATKPSASTHTIPRPFARK